MGPLETAAKVTWPEMVNAAQKTFDNYSETQTDLAILHARDTIKQLQNQVETLEKERDIMLEGLERIGWPCRLVELPEYYRQLVRVNQEQKELLDSIMISTKNLPETTTTVNPIIATTSDKKVVLI